MFASATYMRRSLSYLTYPTRVMFKSSKVVPVMATSVFIVGRRCARFPLPQ